MSKNWSWMGPSKAQKCACSDSLKMFFLLCTLPMMTDISVKGAHLAQKCYFYRKTTNMQG